MRVRTHILIFLFFVTMASAGSRAASLEQLIDPLVEQNPGKTGMYVLEKGGEALIARAWLADQATETIDVQYFIWSSDNVGLLATEALLRAADRGVRVRVLVDDLLIDADNETLYALVYHPNVQIRVYNPVHQVGVNVVERLSHLVLDFRGSNQRMHNKMFIVDGKVSITGGRNMSAEYFDFGRRYNYRDRDVLLAGEVLAEMSAVFERYWKSEYAYRIERLIAHPFSDEIDWAPEDDWGDPVNVEQDDLVGQLDELTRQRVDGIYAWLHEYARDETNFLPEMRRAVSGVETVIDEIISTAYWVDAEFISDEPGKNDTWFNFDLGGGGESTRALAEIVENAEESVYIQSPYLVLNDAAKKTFKRAVKRGVDVRINTNSLTSSDNLPAYSGYSAQIDELLKMGIEVYEYRHDAQRRTELVKRYSQYQDRELPIFSLHAKTMVVDDRVVYIGTFNLDPRSQNLNTEVGIVVRDEAVAAAVKREIELDMSVGNSWNVRQHGHNNDSGFFKRTRLLMWKLLPMDPIL